ncbi:MAG: hypothetical protein QOJ99_3240 [Bryobacterales bacterium]|nr:hypothetical protein [Bryobacterales bacterium]
MVQAMSLFDKLMQHFPSLEFAALVKKHNAERAAKGFSCRTQLVAMLFCQLAHADSLREICNGLACCLGKLVHLGIGVAPSEIHRLKGGGFHLRFSTPLVERRTKLSN